MNVSQNFAKCADAYWDMRRGILERLAHGLCAPVILEGCLSPRLISASSCHMAKLLTLCRLASSIFSVLLFTMS